MDQDSRATQIFNNTEDQQEISKIISELQKNNHVNAFFVLSNYLDCPQIKNEPQFNDILFNKHIDIVVQLFQWMLIPKQLIQKKKIKANVDSYPYECRQFFKDNWCFYQHLYIAIRMKKFELSRIFNFLRRQHFDKNTICTALGYFADALIPFVKYQFSGSFNLTKVLTQAFVVDVVETFSFLKILNDDLVNELISYCFYQQIFMFLKTIIFVGMQDSTQIPFAKTILRKLLVSCKITSINKNTAINDNQYLLNTIDLLQNLSNFLKQFVQTLQPQQRYKQQKKSPTSKRQAKEVQDSIQAFQDNYPIIQCIIEQNILEYFVNLLKDSKLCGGLGIGKNNQHQKIKLYSSADLQFLRDNKESDKQHLTVSAQSTIQGHHEKHIQDVDQEQVIEVILKIINTLAEFYQVLPKSFQKGAQILQISQPPTLDPSMEPTSPSSSATPSPSGSPYFSSYIKRLKKATKKPNITEYTNLIQSLNKQTQYLFNNLEILSKIVIYHANFNHKNSINGVQSPQENTTNQNSNIVLKHNQSAKSNLSDSEQIAYHHTKILSFSSGQNIKAISFMKYEYFKLLAKCLNLGGKNQKIQEKERLKNKNKTQMSKQTQIMKQNQKQKQRQTKAQKQPQQVPIKLPQLILPIQKLFIVQILKKYITQNKWNNLAQVVLIQICNNIVTNYYDYIKKSLQKDKVKKFTQSFLSFLIENFSKRDYVFLNTVKFTSQGNVYALYKMSKDIAYTLKMNNQLAKILQQFEPWKNFILNDLKNYEQKIFPKVTMPQDDDFDPDQQMNIKIDEADSIKKLVQNISQPKKLFKKNQNRSKSLVKSSHMPSRNTSTDLIRNSQLKYLSNKKQQQQRLSKKQQKMINQFRLFDAIDRNQLNMDKKTSDKQKKIIKRNYTMVETNKMED